MVGLRAAGATLSATVQLNMRADQTQRVITVPILLANCFQAAHTGGTAHDRRQDAPRTMLDLLLATMTTLALRRSRRRSRSHRRGRSSLRARRARHRSQGSDLTGRTGGSRRARCTNRPIRDDRRRKTNCGSRSSAGGRDGRRRESGTHQITERSRRSPRGAPSNRRRADRDSRKVRDSIDGAEWGDRNRQLSRHRSQSATSNSRDLGRHQASRSPSILGV
jgi:hypothetical protein